MEMPKPTKAHQKLEQLAGSWTGAETCHPSPHNPELSHATGRFTNAVALGGFHVVGDYEQEKNGEVVYNGHAVYSYDPAGDEYVCHWFDGMSPNAQEFRGQWQGDVLMMQHHDPQFGHTRLVKDFAELAAGRYGFRMESSQDGESWSLCLEGTYQRAEVMQT